MTETKTENEEVQDEWMIRPCDVYDEEYSDCTSFRERFNQYFIFGKTLICDQWKTDSNNCYRWAEKKDIKAAQELVKSEKIRRKERLLPHYKNNVWARRKQPPEDWNKPLPKHLLEEYEASYLNQKAKEMRGEAPKSFDTAERGCVLM